MTRATRLGMLLGLCLTWSACAEAVEGTGSQGVTAGASSDVSFPRGGQGTDAGVGAGAADGVSARTDTESGQADSGERFADDHLPDAYDPLCAEEMPELDVELTAASMMLVMDRSGSMVGDNWAAAKSAIQEVVAPLAMSTRMGLQLYPESVMCTISGEPIVPMDFNQADAITNALEVEGVGGSTPMAKGMRNARDAILNDLAPGNKIVILTADGKPSDTCMEDCTGCECTYVDTCTFCADLIGCMEQEITSLVEELADLNVPTYVVGFPGSGDAKDLLNDIATLGGTALDGDTKYYDTTGEADLLEALETITANLDTCGTSIDVPETYDFMMVTLNGETLPKDVTHTDGWDLLEDGTLQFYGGTCLAASAPDAQLKVSFICKYVD